MSGAGGRAAYLAELFRLGGEARDVSTSELADALGVSAPAVVKMMARLEAAGLVRRRPYRGSRLTTLGRREGILGLRSHRLSEAFLVRVMGYGWHEAHDLADAIAEIADEAFVNRMEEKAGFPRRCPHGEPIPDREGQMPTLNDRPLVEAEAGAEVAISRVRTRDPDKLQYLERLGLLPEARIRIAAKAPFAGPVRVVVQGSEQVLGSELARAVFVEDPLEPQAGGRGGA
ncbi:MAG: metal-dependent transcriptional regulator [Anaerolineales bacterium]